MMISRMSDHFWPPLGFRALNTCCLDPGLSTLPHTSFCPTVQWPIWTIPCTYCSLYIILMNQEILAGLHISIRAGLTVFTVVSWDARTNTNCGWFTKEKNLDLYFFKSAVLGKGTNKKSGIRKTMNLLSNVDNGTNIFFFANRPGSIVLRQLPPAKGILAKQTKQIAPPPLFLPLPPKRLLATTTTKNKENLRFHFHSVN